MWRPARPATRVARFRDPDRSLDGFDFAFNKKINRALVFEFATARFVAQREDALLLGPPNAPLSETCRPGLTPTATSVETTAPASASSNSVDVIRA